MDVDFYQKWTRETALYPRHAFLGPIMYTALGLAGEAGEAADKVKKLYRDGVTEELKAGIIAEIGDTIWYAARLADELGVELSAVLINNMQKLTKRMEEGKIKGSGDSR